jgi:hypothetical protein
MERNNIKYKCLMVGLLLCECDNNFSLENTRLQIRLGLN